MGCISEGRGVVESRGESSASCKRKVVSARAHQCVELSVYAARETEKRQPCNRLRDCWGKFPSLFSLYAPATMCACVCKRERETVVRTMSCHEAMLYVVKASLPTFLTTPMLKARLPDNDEVVVDANWFYRNECLFTQ